MLSVLAQAAAPTGLPSDQVVAFVILDIAIILVVARLLGMLALKVGQPRVVGEIVGGILLGPSLLGPTIFNWGSPWKVLACDRALAPTKGVGSITTCLFPPQARTGLGLIGQIALILFMFLVGIELDWALLKGKVTGIISVGLGVVLVPLGLAFAIGPTLYGKTFTAAWGTPAQPSKTAFTLMVAAMLSVTAFPVAVRILQERKLDRSQMGAVTIAAAALVTILMFLLVGVARGSASHKSAGSQVARVVGLLVYLAVMLLVVKPLLKKFAVKYEQGEGLTGTLFAVLMITTLASAYAADRIGVNVIVGGFIAGVVMPSRERLAKDMNARLSDITIVIFLPIFLAFSGLQTDFTKLTKAATGGLALFIVVGIASKWLGGIAFGKLGGLSWGESNVVGVLMNCRGLLVLVVALIALNEKVISPQLQVGGVLMALITTAMTGPLMGWAIARQNRAAVEV